MLIVNGSFADKPLTGVQRYAYEMCLALKAMGHPFRIVAPCPVSQAEYAVLNGHLDVVPRSLLGKAMRWEQADLARYMLGRRKSVLWNPSNLAPMGPFKQITTVHDLSVYRNASWFDWKFAALYKLYLPYSVRASVRVLTVSRSVKDEILARFPVPEGRIAITYNACSFPADSAVAREPGADPFVLLLGSLDPRKNLRNALLAWERMPSEAKAKAKLYVVGGANWRLAFGSERLETPADGSVRFLGRVEDAELESLLGRCIGSLNLSRYEGFGIPILEALMRNKRCLVSDIPVFRELFREGCSFVDPEDVPAISRALAELIESGLTAPPLDVAGRYAKRYSWRRSAETLVLAQQEVSQG
jgi:glycosyltransferase involved in cell wall biosynthesis